MVKLNVYILSILLIFIFPFQSFSQENDIYIVKCDNESLDNLYSNYRLYNFQKFRGSIKTKEQAKNVVTDSIVLERNEFSFKNELVEYPSYEKVCYKSYVEGEIPTHRWSSFYGFEKNRAIITTLNVFDKKGEQPIGVFEVVDNELWWMSSSWIYKFKKDNSNE